MTDENKESYNLYLLIQDQVRVAGFGQIIGLDLGAVTMVFSTIGVTDIKKELLKMKLFHHYLVQENPNKEEK